MSRVDQPFGFWRVELSSRMLISWCKTLSSRESAGMGGEMIDKALFFFSFFFGNLAKSACFMRSRPSSFCRIAFWWKCPHWKFGKVDLNGRFTEFQQKPISTVAPIGRKERARTFLTPKISMPRTLPNQAKWMYMWWAKEKSIEKIVTSDRGPLSIQILYFRRGAQTHKETSASRRSKVYGWDLTTTSSQNNILKYQW